MKNKYKFGSTNFKNTLVNVNGPSHEKGGVDISKNVEVEGEEAIMDGFVFSNRLMYKDGKTFSDKAKEIEKRYSKDKSNLGEKTKKIELDRLSQEQETMKAELAESVNQEQSQAKSPNGMPNMPTQQPQQMAYGGNMKKKMFLGGAIARGIGAAVNIGRGLWEKPRQYDDISLERATANTIDLEEQRRTAGITSNRNRRSTNETIRGNAGSAGQLLGNTLYNNARSTDDLNRVQAESYMNEENVNAQIKNQVDQFNTQIGNQETMQNFNIGMMNDRNKDAKRELMFKGIGDLLGVAGGFSNDMFKMNRENSMIDSMYDLSDKERQSLFGDRSFRSMMGFGDRSNRKPKSSGPTRAVGGMYI